MKQSSISPTQKKKKKTFGSWDNREWVHVRKQKSRLLSGQRPKAQRKPRNLK